MYQGWFTKWTPPKRAGKLSCGEEKNGSQLTELEGWAAGFPSEKCVRLLSDALMDPRNYFTAHSQSPPCFWFYMLLPQLFLYTIACDWVVYVWNKLALKPAFTTQLCPNSLHISHFFQEHSRNVGGNVFSISSLCFRTEFSYTFVDPAHLITPMLFFLLLLPPPPPTSLQ